MIENVFDLSSFSEVELIVLSDWHIGHPLCNEELIQRTCEYIKQEPENKNCARVCILNGDMMDTVTRTSKFGDVFNGMTYSPQTQIAICKKYLLPLTETSKKYPKGKIISNAYGNHDHMRQHRDSDISCSTSLACGLGIEDRSTSDGIYTFLKLKSLYRKDDKMIYTIYNTHGSGGGCSIGAKANRLEKISNQFLADLIIMGHTHTAMTYKEDIVVPQTNTQTTRMHTTTFVNTASMISFGDYGERGGMRPQTVTIPRIYLKQERHTLQIRKNRVDDKFLKSIEVIL